MTKYFCDMCKKSCGESTPSHIRIEDKMHDFCEECLANMRSIMDGSGIPIVLEKYSGGIPATSFPTLPTNPFTMPYPFQYPGPNDIWTDKTSITYGNISNGPDFMNVCTSIEDPILSNSFHGYQSYVNNYHQISQSVGT